MDRRSYAKTKLMEEGGSWVEGQRIRGSDKRLKMSPRVTEGTVWNPTLPVPGNFQKPGLLFRFWSWGKGGIGEKPDILLSAYYEPDMFQTLSH